MVLVVTGRRWQQCAGLPDHRAGAAPARGCTAHSQCCWCTGGGSTSQQSTPHRNIFPAAQTRRHRRVFSYLRGSGIDPEIINHCIKHGLLYESEQYHNCVFVGFADGRPAYAMQRGTLQEKRFVGEVIGSDKRYSFAVPVTPGGSGGVEGTAGRI